MLELLIDEPGRVALLLGNEGLVRGALEAGLAYASCYPGTPTSAPCPGCPHRMTYYAVKQAAPDNTIFFNDIGCYTLGFFPPYQTVDCTVCIGASASMPCGFDIASDQPIIAEKSKAAFVAANLQCFEEGMAAAGRQGGAA
jgi:TPP-dependent indolepyruvate ferredoxin oxidoreductase alpha subunit